MTGSNISVTYSGGGRLVVNGNPPRSSLTISGTGVTVTDDANNDTTDLVFVGGAGGGGTITGGTNLGTGTGIFADVNGVNLEYKSLVAGANIALSNNTTTITIAATGVVTGQTNLGTGTVIGAGVSGGNSQLKSLVAGANITLTNDASTITIVSTAAGGGGGTITDGANIGTLGFGPFANVSGVNLQFYNIAPNSTKIAITQDAVNHNILVDVVQANLSLASIGGTAAYSQLNLSGSIVNADISTIASIAKSKLAALNIGDSDLSTFTTTKISITAKAQLNSAIVYTDQANIFGAFNQTFPSSRLLIQNPAATFAYTIVGSAITAARNITLPLLTGNDQMTTDASTTTMTNKSMSGASNTFTNIPSTALPAVTVYNNQANTYSAVDQTIPAGNLKLSNSGFSAALTTGTLAAGITLTLPSSTDTIVGRATTDTLTNKTLTSPTIATIINTGTLTLPTSTDTLMGRATTDTVSNKTLSASSNTITDTSAAVGDILAISSGTAFKRLAMGTANQVLAVNSAGTALTWTTNTGGSGAPTSSAYVTIGSDATLTAERALTVTKGIVLTDAGANSTVTLDTDPTLIAKNRFTFYDDFIYAGGFGGYGASTGTSAAYGNYTYNDVTEAGEIFLQTGSTSTGAAAVYDSTTNIPFGSGTLITEWRIKILSLSNGTDQYKIRVGVFNNGNSASADATYGVYFEYDQSTDTHWKMCTANNSVRTKTASTTLAAVGWARLKLVVNAAGTSVSYYYNDTLLGSVTTNIPPNTVAGAGQPFFQLVKNLGTTSITVLADYVAMSIDWTTQR